MSAKAKIYSAVNTLPYFTIDDLRGLGVDEKNLEMVLHRATAKGEIIRLRRGVYTTAVYFNRIRILGCVPDYLEFLANVLVQPSYITAEYVLSKYELLTESVTTITSYTTGRPTLITNSLAVFRYRNISTNLLSHFETVQKGEFTIKQASKVQAIIDYLYFKKKTLTKISEDVVSELRLNLHLLSPVEMQNLRLEASKISSRKLNQIVSCLEDLYASK